MRVGRYGDGGARFVSTAHGEYGPAIWEGFFPCPECPGAATLGAEEELKSLGFSIRVVERDEQARNGSCDLFFSFNPDIEWPMSHCLWNFTVAKPILANALLVDLRNGQRVLHDGQYTNKEAETKFERCIEGLHNGDVAWAVSPEGMSAISRWTTLSTRRLVLLFFQEHKLIGQIETN